MYIKKKKKEKNPCECSRVVASERQEIEALWNAMRERKKPMRAPSQLVQRRRRRGDVERERQIEGDGETH